MIDQPHDHVSGLWPVYVPSKGRPNPSTVRLLRESGLLFNVVIEPQDQAAYEEARSSTDNLCVLPDNDQGIAYVRNKILELEQHREGQWYWMLDDDITAFHWKGPDGKLANITAVAALRSAQTMIPNAGPMVVQAALEYRQFAWCQEKPARNSYCDVAVAIHASRVGNIRYRAEMNLKEDRDFTLQLLSSGWDSIRLTGVAFSAPSNGANAGGLHSQYQAGKEALAVQRMCRAWGPQVCEPHVKPNGRQDLRIHWRQFRRR